MKSDLPDLASARLPTVMARDARTVERGFWKKVLKVAGRIPFAEEAGAAYFCAADAATPSYVKGILLAALAYFVTPVDLVPDFVAGIGFTDDAAVLATAIGLVSGHIRPRHRARARNALGLPQLPDEG